MPLSPLQRHELVDALRDGFDESTVTMMLGRLGIQGEHLPVVPNRYERVLTTVRMMEDAARVDELIRVARQMRPTAAALKAFVQRHGMDFDSRTPGNTAALSSVDTEAKHAEPDRTLFLCYRRDDTQDAAGRLHDRLVAAYGSDRVFMDVASVPPGVDFVERVRNEIAQCSAMIVVIGKRWLTLKNKRGGRRLDDEGDLVRIEISTALQEGIHIVPVFVRNASMPNADDLPDDIRALARVNGMHLRTEEWSDGVERLLRQLDTTIKGAKRNTAPSRSSVEQNLLRKAIDTAPGRSKNRPKVAPRRFDRGPISDDRTGLFLANEGTTAYGLSVPEVQLGEHVLHADTVSDTLTHTDGEVFVELGVERSTPDRRVLELEDLPTFMRDSKTDRIELEIRYHNVDGRRYSTTVTLTRDVRAKYGVTIESFALRRVPGNASGT